MSLRTLSREFIQNNRRTSLFLTDLCFQSQSYRSLTTTKHLSPTISFLTTNSTKPLKTVRGSPLILDYTSHGRPLSVLLCWLQAKTNAVNKYANFYMDKGFDVLTVRITPTQLLLPTRTNKIVDNELMPFLRGTDHPKTLVHGFSVGGYVFAQMLRLADQQPELYEIVFQRMVAQIWDSVVDVNGAAVGVSKSVFPNAKLPQKLLKDYIDLHMRVMYGISTKYYDIAHHYFYNKPLRSPSLFFTSKSDPISPVSTISAVHKSWKALGLDVETKSWENTPHVGHMQKHPNEYKDALTQFLYKVGIRPEEGHLVDTGKTPIFSSSLNTAIS